MDSLLLLDQIKNVPNIVAGAGSVALLNKESIEEQRDMENIVVRSAVMADLEILLQFEQGIIEAERPYDHMLKPDPISYYDIGEMIGSDDAEVAVAELDGNLIGSGYAKRKQSRHYLDPEEHAFIGFLYVSPEHRGRGVNKLVLDHLFAWAKAQGLPEVHLTVYPDNAPAIKAYEKVGFNPYLLEMRLNLEEDS